MTIDNQPTNQTAAPVKPATLDDLPPISRGVLTAIAIVLFGGDEQAAFDEFIQSPAAWPASSESPKRDASPT